MKRLYFIVNGIQPAHEISNDVTRLGFNPGQLHFMNKNDYALDRQGVNQTNIFEEKDIAHSGVYGGFYGFIAGLVFTALLFSASDFGEIMSMTAAIFVIGLFTAFGTWAGGIVGISKDNHHIEPYHEEIENGKTLLMVDAYNDQQEKKLQRLMTAKHREAQYKGKDENYREFL